MRRSTLLCLAFIVVLAVGSFGATLYLDKRPQLGLDLQGGAYVVLQPDRKVDAGVLNQSVEIIRSRVDELGVAEPDIRPQGDSIIVQLPGVKEQARALEIVGQTAELRFRPVLQSLPPEQTAATTTTSAPDPATTTTEVDPAAATTSTTVAAGTTPREQDLPDQEVVLPMKEKDRITGRLLLGPAKATGTIVRSARAQPPQGPGDWAVSVELTSKGNELFNQIAAACFDATPECPTKQVAIVLDGVVRSAPAVQERSFSGRVQITGQFSESEAKDLALVLKFGALPVELTPQSTQTVSPTLGRDSLRAGITAGLLGLGLVLLYMIMYYRALGVVVVLGLGVSGMLLWSFVSFLGAALTLAGAVGIIISVGVTVDSYVVFFERLKDEIRSGKTIRSSVDRGFTRAYRTIVAADISSLIGAGLLYALTVGSVRGFAFFLGVSALLDLFVAFFFTRPMVSILGRSRLFTEARFFGVARGLGAGDTTAVPRPMRAGSPA
ncbi:MAG: protein translocase subunit SecD [Actinobacteria bacterium]|nr:protein translocase subunit SecD [Actinomycetota bacterium]MBW3649532.1 protein translocase subunit SecD [Actinomycetota bacterium]